MQQLVERDHRPAEIKTTPYWWDDVPRPAPTTGALPKSVDVLVIGHHVELRVVALAFARK